MLGSPWRSGAGSSAATRDCSASARRSPANSRLEPDHGFSSITLWRTRQVPRVRRPNTSTALPAVGGCTSAPDRGRRRGCGARRSRSGRLADIGRRTVASVNFVPTSTANREVDVGTGLGCRCRGTCGQVQAHGRTSSVKLRRSARRTLGTDWNGSSAGLKRSFTTFSISCEIRDQEARSSAGSMDLQRPG